MELSLGNLTSKQQGISYRPEVLKMVLDVFSEQDPLSLDLDVFLHIQVIHSIVNHITGNADRSM